MKILNKHKDEIPEGAVMIGRQSAYGNPFVLGRDGDRDQVVARFRLYAIRALLHKDSALLRAILKLKEDDVLVCYCKPKSCHGDIIVELWTKLQTDGVETTLEWCREQVKHMPASDLREFVNPLEDGESHINIYSGGKTKLGRWLSNFEYQPFEHPEFGKFDSVEGFWYWLKTGKKFDVLRTLSGWQAKKFGKELPSIQVGNFRSQVCQALFCKLQANEGAQRRLAESTLPFVHYYVFGDPLGQHKVNYNPEMDWISKYIEMLRLYYQGSAQRVLIAGSRTIKEESIVREAYATSGFNAVEIVSGTAGGVDRMGESLAEIIPTAIRRMPADWNGPAGKGAGMVRNGTMVDYVDVAVVIHDGESPGTANTLKRLQSSGKPFKLTTIKKE